MQMRHSVLTVLVSLMMAIISHLPTSCRSGCLQSEELAGTWWTLVAWSISAQNPNDFTITAAFEAARISGTAAVNQYSGSYRAGKDGSIQTGVLAVTLMAGPPEAMEAERRYLELLAQAKRFRMRDAMLTLSDEHGNTLLIFEMQ